MDFFNPFKSMGVDWRALNPFANHDNFKPESAKPIYDEYERMKESAANMITGRQALASSGIQARLGTQGVANVPGIQTAVTMPRQYQANEQLAGASASIDLERSKALERKARFDFAKKQYEDEKDEAKKARWAKVLGTIAGVGLTLATGGLGAAAVPAITGVASLAGGNVPQVPEPQGENEFDGWNPEDMTPQRLPWELRPRFQRSGNSYYDGGYNGG
jgi:hypothetical protein